jgi:hypothetical protein
VRFLLNARQATGVSNVRGVRDGFAQHTHLSAPGHAFRHVEARVPSQSSPALSPVGIAAALECATFLREANNALCVTGRIAPC